MSRVLLWSGLSVGLHVALLLGVPAPQVPARDDSLTMVFTLPAETGRSGDAPTAPKPAQTVQETAPAPAPSTAQSPPKVAPIPATVTRPIDVTPAPPEAACQPPEPPPATEPPAPAPAPPIPDPVTDPLLPQPPEVARPAEPRVAEPPPAEDQAGAPTPSPPEPEPQEVIEPADRVTAATEVAVTAAPRAVPPTPAPDFSSDAVAINVDAAAAAPAVHTTAAPETESPGNPAPRPGASAPAARAAEPGKSLPGKVPPRLRRSSKPRYPRVARRRGWEGVVLLRVLVGSDGRIKDVELEQSSGHSVLDRAAVGAIRQWLFHPAQEGETPIAGELLVPVRFDLLQAG